MILISFLYNTLLILICMTGLFLLACRLKDNSVVDIFWGLGFAIIALFTMFISGDLTLKKALVCIVISAWGLRLSVHIFLRNRGRGEDFRYRNWRETWKNFYLQSFFKIFMLQGILMLIIASPVILINASASDDPGFLDICGLIFFFAGFAFEVIGDTQLARFRAIPENKGNLVKSGLWQYTRHPNYFGEALLWWGIWLMAVPEVNGLFTIVSPIVITLLLRYVSGVPMLEKKYEGRSDWEEYKSKVPAFIPRFRHKSLN